MSITIRKEHGAPTTNTVGFIGEIYEDINTGDRYECSGIYKTTGSKMYGADCDYHWEKIDMIEEKRLPSCIGSWDELPGKPFYETTKVEYVITDADLSSIEQLSQGMGKVLLTTSGIAEGATYYMEYGGQIYEAVAHADGEVQFHNVYSPDLAPEDQWPMSFSFNKDNYVIILDAFSTIRNWEGMTVSLYTNVSEVAPLDPKFIPELTSITMVSDNGTKFKVAVSDDGALTATEI